MDTNHRFAIGVLSITATILLVGVILTTVGGNNAAVALGGQLDRGGDYILVTGQFTQNTELVYVTDAAVGHLNIYSYEPSTRRFVLWGSQNLNRLSQTSGR